MKRLVTNFDYGGWGVREKLGVESVNGRKAKKSKHAFGHASQFGVEIQCQYTEKGAAYLHADGLRALNDHG